MLQKKFATYGNWSAEKQITYRKPILGTTSFNLNTKLLPLLIPTILIIGVLGTCPFSSAQMEISPTPTPHAQPARSPQMQGMEGMEKMSDSVTKMSEMCQMMMKKEMAGARYKMAAGAAFGVVLFLDLLLLVVLETQWIYLLGSKIKV